MRNGERRKIDVRHLPGSRQPPTVHDGIVEQAYVVGDEPVMRRGHGGVDTAAWRRAMASPTPKALGYRGWERMRTHPFCVRGQETHPDSMRSASQSDAAA